MRMIDEKRKGIHLFVVALSRKGIGSLSNNYYYPKKYDEVHSNLIHISNSLINIGFLEWFDPNNKNIMNTSMIYAPC